MKHVIILGDGMADYPVARLGGKTPLQVARHPHMDRLAREGRCGLFKTIEDDMPTGSEAANLSVLGYNPREVLQGRGVLEAASMGVNIAGDDMAMRCNLICLFDDGRIKNHSAGHISSAESDAMLKTLQQEIGRPGLNFYTGVSYRHLFVGQGLDPRLDCAPPHDHPNEPAAGLTAPERRARPTVQCSLTAEARTHVRARKPRCLLILLGRPTWGRDLAGGEQSNVQAHAIRTRKPVECEQAPGTRCGRR